MFVCNVGLLFIFLLYSFINSLFACHYTQNFLFISAGNSLKVTLVG